MCVCLSRRVRMLSHKDPGTGCAPCCFCPLRCLFCGVWLVCLCMAPQQPHSPPAPYCCYCDWGVSRGLNSEASHFAPDHSCLDWERHKQKKCWAIFNNIINLTWNKIGETRVMLNYCKQKSAERVNGLCVCHLVEYGVIKDITGFLGQLLRLVNWMT